MIENIRRKFPGVMFHHIDTTKIGEWDSDRPMRRVRAIDHNSAHIQYLGIQSERGEIELKYFKGLASLGEFEQASAAEKDAWDVVISTNNLLPKKLQGNHV